ncbi:MAG: hypothetical protein JJU45_14920 [Acidimicrobiia bacterium]|nr:hypothetical protein [Acidimicrobiia bacterium]
MATTNADHATGVSRPRSATSSADVDAGFAERLAFFDDVLRRWLRSPDTTVACGSWADGAIAEFVPGGSAELLPPAYSGCFEGVRELRLPHCEHHLHVDLGRVHRLVCSVAPSVCFGGRPSFEVRFLTTGAGGAPSSRWLLSCMLTAPYEGDLLVTDPVRWYLETALEDQRRHPDLVRFEFDEMVFDDPVCDDLRLVAAVEMGMPDTASWPQVLDALQPAVPASVSMPPLEPCVLGILDDALRLADASLVIYRDRLLVELQTEQLDGVHRYVEDGHVSWQVGATHDHHCHLALGAVTHVEFTAEPVPCQGGRANYTVWFLVPGRCGNPYRVDGYFSVVLNRPYVGGEERLDVIEPMLELYRRYASSPWVTANEAFLVRVNECGVEGGGHASSQP